MNTAVLVLAATSSHTGWKHATCRHLVDIGGEPLLVRTLRQLAELGHDATVVTNKPEIRAAIPNCFVPEDHTWLVSTILSARELWDDKTIVLMGDAVWDLRTLDAIMSHEEFPVFYGSHNEIHALAWLREHFGRFEANLRGTEVYMRADPDPVCYLKHFYAMFCNKDWGDGRTLKKWEERPYWCMIDSPPEMDNWQDYERVMWEGTP